MTLSDDSEIPAALRKSTACLLATVNDGGFPFLFMRELSRPCTSTSLCSGEMIWSAHVMRS